MPEPEPMLPTSAALRYSVLCAVLLASPAPVFGSGNDGGNPAPGNWVEETKLVASDGEGNDEFGYAVALDGDTAIVGSWRDEPLGSAYVFVRRGSGWALQAKLAPADGVPDGEFGCSVAISGNTALVGRKRDNEVEKWAGAVHVYVRSGTTWTQQAKLSASDADAVDFFGGSVSLEGDTALIGAYLDEDPGGEDAGSAYVFIRSGVAWSEQAKLVAADASGDEFFGRAVSLSGDTALIGASVDEIGYPQAGSAYVFVRSGATWAQQAKLVSGDEYWYDHFGWAVSVDGDTALVGVEGDDTDAGENSGSAYVFVRSGAIWTKREKLTASDGAKGEHFGSSVALSGGRALIGAISGYPSWGPGSAYVFEWTGAGWTEQAKLEASDGDSVDNFGFSVALDGDSALIGAYGDDDLGWESGAAYVFCEPPPPGTGYCSGDPGSGTPCPCGNDNDGSVPGSGCDNGVFASGAQLTGSGIASVGNDSLVLVGARLEPWSRALYFQANGDLSPGVVWGNGLRCAGYGAIRLQAGIADVDGNCFTTLPIAAKGGVAAGETHYYQLWYRTTFSPPCGPGVGEFNTTNGYVITWQP